VNAAGLGQLLSRGGGLVEARSHVVRDGKMYSTPRALIRNFRSRLNAPVLWLSCMRAALQWLGNLLIS